MINAKLIIKTLNDNGYQAFIVGGYVRDFLMGIESNDIDIVTDALPDKIESIFASKNFNIFTSKNFSIVTVGKSFGIIIVVINDKKYEIATFRSDSTYSDGRHPDSIQFSNIYEDSNRRDLTINALYWNPLTGESIDLVNGKNDLNNKIIRFIGNANERIKEDNLRLIRAIRFITKFNFKIPEHDSMAIINNANLISNVSYERIRDEVTKILRLKNRDDGIRLLSDYGILKYILPEFENLQGCTQTKKFHPEGDVFIHSLLAISKLPEDCTDELLWATLLHDIGKPLSKTIENGVIRFNGHEEIGEKIARDILTRFKFPNSFIDDACEMILNHMKFMHSQNMKTSKLKRFCSLKNIEEMIKLHKSDCESSDNNLADYHFIKNKLEEFKLNPEKNIVKNIITKFNF